MSEIGNIMEYNEEVEKRNKKKRNAKEIYSKYRESHLKAQKKYDDKNREKKHQYDKERWQKTKQMKEENEQLHSIIKEVVEIIEEHIENVKYLGNIYSDEQILKMVVEKLGGNINERI